MNRTTVGYAGDSTPGFYLNAAVAEVFIYNVALEDSEIAALGTHHVSPRLIRPQSLVFYYPGMAGDQEMTANHTMTFTGSGSLSTTENPRIIHPSRPLYIPFPAAAVVPDTKNTRSHPLGQHLGMARRMVS